MRLGGFKSEKTVQSSSGVSIHTTLQPTGPPRPPHLQSLLLPILIQVKSQAFGTSPLVIPEDAYQSIGLFVKGALQADHHKLKGFVSLVSYVICNSPHIGIVQGCIDLVQHKKRRGLIAMTSQTSRQYPVKERCKSDLPMDCKEQGQCGHGLFTSRELIHVSEAFHGGHGVVLDSMKIRLLYRQA